MPKAKKPQQPFTDALKSAIRESGLSMRQISRDTGVIRQSLMRFMSGETSLRLDIADKLAVYFELDVTSQSEKSNG